MIVPGSLTHQEVIERIDAIMLELATLRHLVAQQRGRPNNLALSAKLFGSLGQGSWEEWEPQIDWQRFDG